MNTTFASACAGALMIATAASGQEMQLSDNGTRPTTIGSPETFTGTVLVTPLFAANEVMLSGAGEVTFAPGARSAWHTHPAGQMLILTHGAGWVQEDGGEKRLMRAGDVIWTPPGVRHWHGATDTTSVTHIAVQQEADGRNVDWMEQVTDEEYGG